MLLDMHAIGKSTPLMLTAGDRGAWTLAIVVDGVRHEFTGKHIMVAGWDYIVQAHDDGAVASGALVAACP